MTEVPPPTPEESSTPSQETSPYGDVLAQVSTELKKVYVGQETLVEQVLLAILANGHILVESLPGLGKTLLVKTLGKVLGLKNRRIQFTPDLMPADITGSHIFNLDTKAFEFQPGPIFSQFLLADELNQSPAKTHAALLEVMQEQQVTLDSKSYKLNSPFLVMATQNPIESEGTYNLPEAALDRFLVKVVIDYPDATEEANILNLFLAGSSPEAVLQSQVNGVLSAEDLVKIQEAVTQVHVDASIVDYITALVRTTRENEFLYMGASPRASVGLLKLARASALMAGRQFVVPDDVADNYLPVLRHRVILAPEAEIEGRHIDDVLRQIRETVEVPRQTAS